LLATAAERTGHRYSNTKDQPKQLVKSWHAAVVV
jgi:hypothetical protein